jgi:hypothetical protein
LPLLRITLRLPPYGVSDAASVKAPLRFGEGCLGLSKHAVPLAPRWLDGERFNGEANHGGDNDGAGGKMRGTEIGPADRRAGSEVQVRRHYR